jgi:UPF0755 protein
VSDDFGRGYPGDDPFVDQSDPEAVERAERRREREEKRASKRGKKAQKEAAAPPPPKPTPPAPTTKPRTPEQEFWDEPAEPATPAPTPQPPVPGQEAATPAPPPKAPAEEEKPGRRKLFGRRKKAAAAGAAGAAAVGGAAAAQSSAAPTPSGAKPTPTPAPPTAETDAAAKEPPTGPGESPTGEQPTAIQPGPPAAGEPVADPGPPTAEQPMPKQPDDKPEPHSPGPPTDESARPEAGPPTAETERSGPPTAETPRRDPGDVTADSPQLDPNRPTSASAVPGDASGPSTREHRAQPPRPVDETGAGDWEAPPPRDDDWFDSDEHDFHDEGDPTMTGAARSGRRHGDDNRRRGGILGALLRHPFRILGVIVLVVILLFLNALFQPLAGDGHGKKVVTIPKGSSVGEVGDLLEKEGVIGGGFVISGSTLFQARVTIAGKRSELHAGKFTMQEDMSYGDAIDQLSEEPKVAPKSKPGVITLTIPEGQSRPITAKLLKEDGIKGNYIKATKKSKLLNPAEYGGKGAKNLEGFLFPDTWDYRTNRPVKDLVALQLQDFKKKIKQVNMKYAKSKNLTVYDVVTIASMIEREAGVPKQRKLVASVIYNRLHEGMTLGIDSTIRFATGNYEKPLTQSELESESPYNTRTHQGLPPGPINSPGLAAMNAAAHPAKTDFLFYVNNPNSCNELTFAKTEEEFLADAEKYENAREKNGGNQPTTCK